MSLKVGCWIGPSSWSRKRVSSHDAGAHCLATNDGPSVAGARRARLPGLSRLISMTAIERYGSLTGETVEFRYTIAELGITFAKLGPVALTAGEESAIAPLRSEEHTSELQ